MANSSKPGEEIATDQDAIGILTADHERVKRLFAEFENLKEDGHEEEKYSIVRQICQELTVHTALEEEIFYPAVRKAIDDADLMDEALVEHGGAKNLVALLQAAHPDDDLYDARVTVLGEQIDHHVIEEEGAMFPKARRAGVDGEALGAQMLARKADILANPPAPAGSPSSKHGKLVETEVGEAGLMTGPRTAANSSSQTRSAGTIRKTSKKKR